MLGLLLATASDGLHAQGTDDNMVTPSLPLEFDRGRNIGVLDRPRPEYTAQGVPLGGFTLQPKAELGVGYTTNAYQNSSDQGDGYVVFSPSGVVSSHWSRHELTASGGASLYRYFTQGRRNRDGWNGALEGRFDATADVAIAASARVRKDAEPPTSAAYPSAAAESSQYLTAVGQIAPTATLGRMKLQGSYSFSTTAFDPVRSFSGALIDQANRNSHAHSGILRSEYAVSPDTSLFLQGSFDRAIYLHPLAPGVPNRDSRTYRALAGATFDLATLVRGAVGVGYMSHRYDTPLYRNFADFTAEARVDYFASPLTTVTLTARRIAQDATLLDLGGYINSSVALRVDHELRRNILLDAQGAYEHDAFKGTPASLDIVKTSAGVRYMATRVLGFGLSVEHDQRRAHNTALISPYSETRVMLRVVIQK
ncbi:outer membrane beta-barrel protein [Novosphingobium terrae]|uniref:outer membrane beta-barrel protein n=1 Tax=Novosphingobium terrae TaxID=2726189 RepID=UPI00197F5980|nr:outer membrane beta-barrel protein [Novosphingobium terrae]